jgi:hypothetical protein
MVRCTPIAITKDAVIAIAKTTFGINSNPDLA